MTKPQNLETTYLAHTLIVGIQAPYNQAKNIQSYFDEFINLVKSNGIHYDHALFIKLREIDHRMFLTPGKAQELLDECLKHNISDVIVSEPLSAVQEKNMADFLNCRVFDRTSLILDIFKHSAHTVEGKLQVEIAGWEFKKTRLTGKGLHLAQQRGGIAVKGGPGETLKEKETRIIEDMVLQLRRRLEKAKTARETQRKHRIASHVPHICLIGYTNAGKSTILNALTKAHVLAEDKLFATLDTTTRELYIDSKKKGVISDTVGFIQFLPPTLIEAFKSTLSELHHANLLLQIIDVSDPGWSTHIDVVGHILMELNVKKPMYYIFNKADRLSPEQLAETKIQVASYKPHAIISSLTKDGIAPLVDLLRAWQP